MHKLLATLLALAFAGAGVALLTPAAAHSCTHSNLTDPSWCTAHFCYPDAKHHHVHRLLGQGGVAAHYCRTTAATTDGDSNVYVPEYGVGEGPLVHIIGGTVLP